jgi:zinc protease
VTLESLEIIRDILAGYPDRFDASDLETTRSYLVRSNARAFETLGDQIGMLSEISAYGLPFDYVREEEEIVRGMTIDRVRELARLYADPDRMVYLVVGDAETQLPRLRQLGMGEPILLEAAP